MLSRIYHFLKGPNPLHPAVLSGRLRPLEFRRYRPEDRLQCLDLYTLNEPGRFPAGFIEQYESSLLHTTSYYLVSEDGGRLVCSGGLSYYLRRDIVVLCFGLVHPSQQGRGLGTALLLARLALLKPNRRGYHIFIGAVEPSFGFYERFGFRTYHQSWKDPQGVPHPVGHLFLASDEIRRCRSLLKEKNIELPSDEDEIPLRTKRSSTNGCSEPGDDAPVDN